MILAVNICYCLDGNVGGMVAKAIFFYWAIVGMQYGDERWRTSNMSLPMRRSLVRFAACLRCIPDDDGTRRISTVAKDLRQF